MYPHHRLVRLSSANIINTSLVPSPSFPCAFFISNSTKSRGRVVSEQHFLFPVFFIFFSYFFFLSTFLFIVSTEKKRTQRQTFNTEQMQLIFNSILFCYSTWARRGSQGLVWRTKGSFILVYAVSLIRICSRLILFFYFSSSSFSNVAVTL